MSEKCEGTLKAMDRKLPEKVYLKTMPKPVMPLPSTYLSTRELASTDRRNETKNLRQLFKTKRRSEGKTESPTLLRRHLLPPFDKSSYEIQKEKNVQNETRKDATEVDNLPSELVDDVLHRKIIERPTYVRETQIEPTEHKEYLTDSPRREGSVFYQPVVDEKLDETGRRFRQHFVDPEWPSEKISLKRLQDPSMSDFHKL